MSLRYSEDRAKQERGNDDNSSKSNSYGINKSIVHKIRLFVYTFTIMGLTRLYLAHGSSTKSERNVFDRALVMLAGMDVDVKPIRLAKYYLFPTYVDKLDSGCRVYVLPRKNLKLNGSQKWKGIMKEFTRITMEHLEQCHQVSNSESGFAADKKMFGSGTEKEDRMNNALFCVGLWYNLFDMGLK